MNLGWALLAHRSAFVSDGTTPILDGLFSVAQWRLPSASWSLVWGVNSPFGAEKWKTLISNNRMTLFCCDIRSDYESIFSRFEVMDCFDWVVDIFLWLRGSYHVVLVLVLVFLLLPLLLGSFPHCYTQIPCIFLRRPSATITKVGPEKQERNSPSCKASSQAKLSVSRSNFGRLLRACFCWLISWWFFFSNEWKTRLPGLAAAPPYMVQVFLIICWLASRVLMCCAQHLHTRKTGRTRTNLLS